jgi:murein DD-endopeptidase MepM/ murein hydrolase activator NlpD
MGGFTFRIAHLDSTDLKTGDTVSRGAKLGVMGNTGQSTGPHGHIDVVSGYHDWMYRLRDIDRGFPAAAFEELHYFVDRELCGGSPYRITTFPYDPRYLIGGKWKAHPGVDIVIDQVGPVFYWNRSWNGTVVNSGADPGYGNFLQIFYTKEA